MMIPPICDYSELGGRLIHHAKKIKLDSIGELYPQHYYTYHQSVDTISRILSLIKAPTGFLLFSGHDDNGLYIQVGIIGRENYVREGKPDIAKLVYGRKWRIDVDTPTTEIVQTALVAVQKVREHEVRELLRWTDPVHGIRTTPFSCHQDINLLTLQLAHGSSLAQQDASEQELAIVINDLRLGERVLTIQQRVPLGQGRVALDVAVGPSKDLYDGFAELEQTPLTLVLQRSNVSHFLHELMESIIQFSHRYCQENFSFCGVTRFSRDHDPRLIAEMSRRSRPYKKHMADRLFADTFDHVNAVVDQNRAPHIGVKQLGKINKNKLATSVGLGGFMPKDYHPER